MNHANLDTLISALEGARDEQFNIRFVFTGASGREVKTDPLHRCGTAACIGGWALHCAGLPRGSSDEAEAWLGLEWQSAWDLFLPDGFLDSPKEFSRRRAIDVLKHLKETGYVDWERFPAANYRGEGAR